MRVIKSVIAAYYALRATILWCIREARESSYSSSCESDTDTVTMTRHLQSIPDVINYAGHEYLRVPDGVDLDEVDLMLVPRDITDVLGAIAYPGYYKGATD